eukprot:Gregarina_sp_Poly_1__859@NODE_1204_length_4788_cov_139_399068_g60_i2_p4_GENE_NODE_1204_length_4788_cov_139_399068_g60_i2NODE_1204_length_4788_cov_139_399068_g60_i2_p4_ORF_typecomplete_len217_score45_75Atg14/PF10186_9/0_038Ribosomal_L30_N/PF08079_12/0_1_NODE_1204_length_4788_cov_139_399068_g60_i2341991
MKRIHDLKVRIDEVKSKLLKLGEALADKARNPKEALDIFKRLDKFGKDLFSAKKEIELERSALGKRRQRALQQTERTPLSTKTSAPALKIKPPAPPIPPPRAESHRTSSGTGGLTPMLPEIRPPQALDESPHKAGPTSPAFRRVTEMPPSSRQPETPRLLKSVATADMTTTPLLIVNRSTQEVLNAMPRSPPAVTMLHGGRQTTDAQRPATKPVST